MNDSNDTNVIDSLGDLFESLVDSNASVWNDKEVLADLNNISMHQKYTTDGRLIIDFGDDDHDEDNEECMANPNGRCICGK